MDDNRELTGTYLQRVGTALPTSPVPAECRSPFAAGIKHTYRNDRIYERTVIASCGTSVIRLSTPISRNFSINPGSFTVQTETCKPWRWAWATRAGVQSFQLSARN